MTPTQQLIRMHDQLQEDAHYFHTMQAFVDLIETYGIDQVKHDIQKYKINSPIIPDEVRLGISFTTLKDVE